MQKCIHNKERQELLLVPGICRLLNMDNQCEDYAPRHFLRLRQWLTRK